MMPLSPTKQSVFHLTANEKVYVSSIPCETTTMNQVKERGTFNPNITLLGREQQEYLNSLGYDVDEKELGTDMFTLPLSTDRSEEVPIINEDAEVFSPETQNEYNLTNEDIYDIPRYMPTIVPDAYQFEEYYSGDEDAVLNNPDHVKKTVPHSPMSKTVDEPLSSQSNIGESNESGNINSDSVSSSIFSDSSNPSLHRLKPKKYAKAELIMIALRK